MKYYLIVGEASGDLHASNLMRALQHEDPQAEFRFFGGDLMKAVGGTCVKHYRELAYMGFIPVLLHLRTIFRNMDYCKKDVEAWQPDVLILVDYPGFNLKIAEYIKQHTRIPVYYYISPKIWAWKEYRIKNIKRDVDELFSILPFEVDFFKKHQYPVHYVGNPCVDAVDDFRKNGEETFSEFIAANGLENRPIIALLAGSRRQEINRGTDSDYQRAYQQGNSRQTEHQPDDGYFAPKEHYREARHQVGFGACHLCRDARVCRSGPNMIRGTYQSSLISASGKSIFSPSTYRLECTTGLSVFIPSTQKSNDMFHVRPVPKSSVKHSFLYILVGPNSPNFRQGPQSSVIPRESPFQAGKSIRVAGTSDSGCPPLPVSSANG